MILIILFMPVAVYLIWVGSISRREAPYLVPGAWDSVALLFAGSGLGLVGGPVLLTSLHDTWRRYWMTGEGPLPYASLEGSRWFWIGIWGLYLVGMAGFAAALIYRRRAWTCIYNIESATLKAIIDQVLQQSGKPYRQLGNLFLIQIGNPAVEESMEVETFAFLRHGALHWRKPESLLRREIEAGVFERVEETRTLDHWGGILLILCGSVFLFLAVLGQLAMAFYLR
ncbi:MAG: hypothetical protein EXR99_07680 [Gemmataceae bacterium]|nr:hypothetical protein [Gemmataceae bacterium]